MLYIAHLHHLQMVLIGCKDKSLHISTRIAETLGETRLRHEDDHRYLQFDIYMDEDNSMIYKGEDSIRIYKVEDSFRIHKDEEKFRIHSLRIHMDEEDHRYLRF